MTEKQDFKMITGNILCKYIIHEKIHMPGQLIMLISMWIMWIIYLESKFSPIFRTSPAPIVINRSPCIHFSDKNFSISLKLGK